jgi:microcystin-dependent protein
MRKILASLLLLLAATPAYAGVPCALPFNLQNGTPADATQVMANYNAIITCLGNAAAAGNNSDITALNGLASPLPPASGGTQIFVATAPSTGSGNSIVVANTTPSGFVLTAGYSVVFVAGATNSGNTTLQVGNSAVTPVYRRTTDGAIPTVGGEIIGGAVVVATYDGTRFQLTTNVVSVPIGTVIMFFGTFADLGFVQLQGQCLPTAGIYNQLWLHLGSYAPGPCATGQFPLPDMRGRVVAGIDSGGSNRITAAGGNFDGTILGNVGGQQNRTLTLNELPAHSHSISDPGHTHLVGGNTQLAGTGGFNGFTAGSNTNAISASSLTGITTTNSTGAGNLFSTLPPIIMSNYEIKY